MPPVRSSISRILAVGTPSADGETRLSRGEHFVCVSGSEREHEQLLRFCAWVESLVAETGVDLADLSGEELSALVQGCLGEDRPA